jgi:hypothetical protein
MAVRLVRSKMQRQTPQVRNFTFTNAQVKALRATPQTLIPAPGAGYAIVVDEVIATASAAAGAWTESSANLAVEYSNDGTDVLVLETTGWIDQAAVSPIVMRPAATQTALIPNDAVRVKNNGAGEIGGGNAANVLRIQIAYRVVPAS